VDGTAYSLSAGAGDEFGHALALGADEILIGAPGEASSDVTDPTNTDEFNTGAAFRYVRDGADWIPDRYLKADPNDRGDEFGFSVGLNGVVFVISAPFEDGGIGDPTSNQLQDSGAVYAIPR
jgi:hypothetical protein